MVILYSHLIETVVIDPVSHVPSRLLGTIVWLSEHFYLEEAAGVLVI